MNSTLGNQQLNADDVSGGQRSQRMRGQLVNDTPNSGRSINHELMQLDYN